MTSTERPKTCEKTVKSTIVYKKATHEMRRRYETQFCRSKHHIYVYVNHTFVNIHANPSNALEASLRFFRYIAVKRSPPGP